MPAEGRLRLMMLALLVTESVRIYALVAALSLLIGEPAALLSWPVIAAILAVAMASGWVTQGLRGDRVTLALLQAMAGLPLMYLAPAARGIAGVPGLDLDWPLRLAGFELSGDAVPAVVFSLALGVILWRRGLALIDHSRPADTLRVVFQTGVAMLAILLLVEVAQGEDAAGRLLLVPFFAAGLGGLAVSELAPTAGQTRGAGFWGRLIAGAVGTLLATGVVTGLLGVLYGGAPLRLLGRAVSAVVEALLLVVGLPLGLLATVLVAILQWLKNWLGTEPQPIQVPAAPAAELAGTPEPSGAASAAHPAVDLLIDVLRYPLLLLLIAGIALALVYGFRRATAGRRRARTTARESIRGDASAASDLAGLLRRLIPDLTRRRKDSERERRYPAGQPGITETFLLYFRYMRAAARRGHSPHESRTPSEAKPGLSEALPGAPVDLLTERFNAACYGREAASEEALRRLRDGLRPFDRGRSGEAEPGD